MKLLSFSHTFLKNPNVFCLNLLPYFPLIEPPPHKYYAAVGPYETVEPPGGEGGGSIRGNTVLEKARRSYPP